MTTYLLATASVHVTAAGVDYLQDRLDPATDAVIVVGVHESGAAERDVDDAANVARARLAAVTPTVDRREGDPTAQLRAAIDEYGPDVIVVGSHDGTAEAAALGSTARELLRTADRPVVVVPIPTRE